MPKGSQTKNQGKNKKGQKGYESKEQRRARLEAQQQAQETCRKVLPFAAGCLFVFLVAFALYVNRVPPKYADKSKTLTPDDLAKMGIPLNGVDVPPEEASARASIPESEVVEEVVADEDEGETVEL